MTRRAAGAEARRGVVLRFASAVPGLLATFALTVLVVRLLPAREAAVYLSVLAALFVGPMLGRLGLGQDVVRLVAGGAGRRDAGQHDDETEHVVGTSLVATAGLSVLTAPLVAWLSTLALQGRPEHLEVAALTALLVVLEAVRLTVSDAFAGLGRIEWAVVTTHHVRSVLTLLALAGYLLVAPLTLRALLLLMLGVSVLLLLPTAALGRDVSLRLGPGGLRRLPPAVVASLAPFTLELGGFVMARADVWLSAAFFAPREAAQYAAASTLAYQITVPVGLAAVALAPTVARLWESGQHAPLRRLLDGVSTAALVPTAVAVALAWLAGGPLMALAYGEDLRAGGVLLGVLATSTLLAAATGLSAPLLVQSGNSRVAARTVLGVLVPVVLLALLAAARGGPLALAVVSSAATAVMALALSLCARAHLGFAVRPAGPAVVRTLVLSGRPS